MMKIISIGHKMPKWLAEGFADYQKRLTKPWQLELVEQASKAQWDSLPPSKLKALEATLILEKIHPHDLCISLDIAGTCLSTVKLSEQLLLWQEGGHPLRFIIGGREGLDQSIIQRSDFVWSLSPLTFPHQMVKVILAEQLYRAVSILKNHPYHRS